MHLLLPAHRTWRTALLVDQSADVRPRARNGQLPAARAALATRATRAAALAPAAATITPAATIRAAATLSALPLRVGGH